MSTVASPVLRIRRPVSRDASRASSTAFLGRCLIGVILLFWAASFIIGTEFAVAALTVVGFLVAAAGITKPELGLLGVGMLATLDALTRVFVMTGGVLRWNSFNYWLLLVMLLTIPLVQGLRDLHSRILQGFLALLLLGLLVSSDRAGGIQHILNIATMFGLVVYFSRAVRHANILPWLGLVNGTLAAAGCLVFYLRERQQFGLIIDANAWAYFPATALFCICLGFPLVPRRSPMQLGLIFLGALNFLWVLLSGSRGTLLVAAVCLLFLLLGMHGVSRRLAAITIAVALAGLIFTLFGDLHTAAVQRITKLLDSSYSIQGRTSGRWDLALTGWDIFLDHPLGIGTGGYPSEHARVAVGEVAHAGKDSQAHSMWIKTLAENGILGVLFLAAYVVSFAFIGWIRRHQALLKLGVFTTIVLALGFLSTEGQGKGLWFLAAATTVLLHQGKEIFASPVRLVFSRHVADEETN